MKKSFIDNSSLVLSYAKKGKTIKKKKAPDGVTLINTPKEFSPATQFNSVFDSYGQQPIQQPMMLNNINMQNSFNPNNRPQSTPINPQEIQPIQSTNKMTQKDFKKLGKSDNDKKSNFNPTSSFLGGLAVANLLLPDVNKERDDNYYNRPENQRYYNPYPNGLNSGALAKHGKTLKTKGDNLQLLSDDTDIEQISPSFHKFKDGKHGVKNEDGTEGVPIAFNGQTVEAQAPETFAVQSDGSGVIFSDKTKNPLTGKSFKSHTEELARFENKHVLRPLKKVESLADDIDEQDPFDKLKANTVIAKQMGIKKAQEFVQQKTDELGQIQQDILDISEQTGMKPNEVSKQMKTAKYGMTIAPDGKELKKDGKTYKKAVKFSDDVKETYVEKIDGKTRRYGEKPGSSKQAGKARPGGNWGAGEDKKMKELMQSGVSPEELIKKGYNDKAYFDKHKDWYKPANSQYEYIEDNKGEVVPIPLNIKPGGIVPKGNVQPLNTYNQQPEPQTFDETITQITPLRNDKIKNSNWKNYVGPAFGVLDRVNNRSDQGYNPRLKDVGEFENRKLNQIQSQGRTFQQGAMSSGANVAELATGMGGFAEQAAASEAEIQAFNQGNKNQVYNENIGIVNDAARFNVDVNRRNNERRLMAEQYTRDNNVNALNTIAKYSATEDKNRNTFIVNQGYYPTYGHNVDNLQPIVKPNTNAFDNETLFQVGDGRYSRNTPSSTQVRVKDGNTTTTNTYTPQKSVTPPKPKKGKYGMNLVKEFKTYKS